MAINIKKIKDQGVVIYPATVLDAVKDAKGSQETNTNYGKTLREILKIITDAQGDLTTLTTDAKTSLVAAINELKTAVNSLPTSSAVSANTEAIATLNGTGDGSVAKAVSDVKTAVLGSADSTNTVDSVSDRVADIEALIAAEETDDNIINKLSEVIAWFAGVAETETGAALIADVAANKTAIGDSTSGLVKDVDDLKNRSNVTVSATDGVSDGTNTYKYTPEEGTVVDADYKHITVSSTGVSDGTNTYAYTPAEGTVVDANYKHITVTENSVSDGTTTINVLTAVAVTDTTDYADVF